MHGKALFNHRIYPFVCLVFDLCAWKVDYFTMIEDDSSGSVFWLRCARAIAVVLALLGISSNANAAAAKAKQFISPDILVLGDSQLSFGSGKLMLDFFTNFDRHCERHVDDKATLARISKMRTTMLGTRSTSLQSWVTTHGRAWNSMCVKDKTWGVNSSVWGHNSTPKRLYYQIGEGQKYQFCKRGKTPLQAMLRDDYYTPELVFFYLIGNGAKRLVEDSDAAASDVKRLVRQLPMHQKCVFMTTTPIHTPRRNKMRTQAEINLRKAFAAHGNRCTFVSAFKPKAVAGIQGKAKYFRRKKSGRVKDPFHPNEAATKLFLDLNKSDVCKAVASELTPMVVSDMPTKKRPASPQVPEKITKDEVEAAAPRSSGQAVFTHAAEFHGAISTAGLVTQRK